jgi:hypothetical protein
MPSTPVAKHFSSQAPCHSNRTAPADQPVGGSYSTITGLPSPPPVKKIFARR